MQPRSTRATQARAATSLHQHEEISWRFQAAPEPRELVWSNLRMRLWQRSLRSILLWLVFIAMTIFYIIPVTLVQVGVSCVGRHAISR